MPFLGLHLFLHKWGSFKKKIVVLHVWEEDVHNILCQTCYYTPNLNKNNETCEKSYKIIQKDTTICFVVKEKTFVGRI